MPAPSPGLVMTPTKLANRLGPLLRAANDPVGLAGDLGHDRVSHVLWHAFEQGFIGLLEFGITINFLHHPVANPLLAVEFLDFSENPGTFQPFQWQSLD